MPRFVDIHTHHAERTENQIRLYDASRSLLQAGYNTTGIHPWYIDQSRIKTQLRSIQQLAYEKKIIAIGECGLDRAISIPVVLQEEVFVQQIEIAEQHNLPLIIHCVKAYSDILRLRKQHKKTPWILHGYFANEIQTQQLLQSDFYYSIGERIIKPVAKHQKAIEQIPIDRIFLESDESAYPIEEIYKAFSSHMKIELSDLQDKILLNFARVFKRD